MPRTQYILIDHQNVPLKDVSRLIRKKPKVIVFTGRNEPQLSEKLRAKLRPIEDQVTVIPTLCKRRNAVDFVLTCELALLAKEDPTGDFHVIAKDKGYEAALKRLRSKRVSVSRHASLDHVPALRSADELLVQLEQDLSNSKQKRPMTLARLRTRIQKRCGNLLEIEVIEKTIRYLSEIRGILRVDSAGKVEYPAPPPRP